MALLIITTILWAFSFSLIGEYLAGSVDSYFSVLMRVGLAALVLFGLQDVWLQLGLSTLAGALVLLGMGLWLRPWRKA